NGPLFVAGLLHLGLRLEGDHPELAKRIYDSFGDRREAFAAFAGEALQQSAQDRLALLHGEGPLASRLEYGLRDVVEAATDTAGILAMGIAGPAFRFTRLTTLAWLPRVSRLGLVTSHALAVAAGFGAETLAFTATDKIAAGVLGIPKWGVLDTNG